MSDVKNAVKPVDNYHDLQFNPKVDKNASIKEKDIFDDGAPVNMAQFNKTVANSNKRLQAQKDKKDLLKLKGKIK